LTGDITAVLVGAQEEIKSDPIPKKKQTGMIIASFWRHSVWAWEIPEENILAPGENMNTNIKVCETLRV
jgi:hypothetical protein